MFASAPVIAPATCAVMYAGTCRHGNLPVVARPSVTAGLMWLPETWPSAYTVAMTTVPNASEIMPRSAMVNGALPLRINAAGTEPTPMNTRNAVPMNSATSFCLIDGSSIACPHSPAWRYRRGGWIGTLAARYRYLDGHSIMSNDAQNL